MLQTISQNGRLKDSISPLIFHSWRSAAPSGYATDCYWKVGWGQWQVCKA